MIFGWNVGDRLHDDDFGLDGTVVSVWPLDPGVMDVVLDVRWDDGTTSDFMPDEKTRRIG